MYTSKVVLIEGTEIHREWPANIREEDKCLFAKEQDVKLAEVALNYYEHKKINSSGIIFSGITIEKKSLIWDIHSKFYNTKYIIKEYLKKKTRKSDHHRKYFVCFDYWSDGYFHWLSEALPRIILVENMLQDEDAVLLLPLKYQTTFHIQTLKIFPDIRISWISDKEIVKCDRLYSPDRLALSGSNNPYYMQKVRERIVNYFKTEKTSQGNIYVSRMKAKKRIILNEDEVIETMKKYDFEIICFEDFSFEEQVRIMQNANNCISIHGANLTNILFMKTGTNVLEFRMKGDPENNYYYALASSCKINYYYQLCDFSMFSTDGNDFNIKVSIPELEKNVQEMLTNKRVREGN